VEVAIGTNQRSPSSFRLQLAVEVLRLALAVEGESVPLGQDTQAA